MTDRISLAGLSKAAVLAALYNASRPQGMGFMHYDPAPMEEAEAEALLREQARFGYLKGRVMKVDLSGDSLNPQDYDRGNGEGSALKVINALRQGEPEDGMTVSGMHSTGKAEAIRVAREGLDVGIKVSDVGEIQVLEFGLADVAEVLRPKIDEAEG